MSHTRENLEKSWQECVITIAGWNCTLLSFQFFVNGHLSEIDSFWTDPSLSTAKGFEKRFQKTKNHSGLLKSNLLPLTMFDICCFITLRQSNGTLVNYDAFFRILVGDELLYNYGFWKTEIINSFPQGVSLPPHNFTFTSLWDSLILSLMLNLNDLVFPPFLLHIYFTGIGWTHILVL